VRRLSAVYPELAVETVCFGPAGQYNDTLIVNRTVIFRFPRFKDLRAGLPGEIAFLRAIQGHVSLPIPDPVYASWGFEVPEAAFIGYPLIPGRPLWRKTLQSLDDHALDVLVTQLAVFLRGLHGVPPLTIADDLPNLDSRRRWAEIYARVREDLFPHLRVEGSLAVAAHFEAFLDYAHNFEYSPALRHGDPGPGNVLFDWASQSLTGIIDFDFAGLGDPAVDWSVVLTPCLYGEAFVRRLLRLHPVSEPSLARARFYRKTWAVHEALRAMEAGDQGAFHRAIAGIDQGRLCCNGPDICLASDPEFWRSAVALD
jgi:aminoglycoside 2''-phosphotransferase